MSIKKAKLAAWAIMLLMAGLMAFIFTGSRTAFAVLEGMFAAYGFVSFGDDLVRFLAQPEGRSQHGRKGRAR